jgi:hypothetical protein
MSISVTSNNEIVITGTSSSNDSDVTFNHGAYDIWIVKTNNIVSGIPKQFPEADFEIGPNPATTKVAIFSTEFEGIEIFNVLGEKVYNTTYTGQVILNCELFPKGIYFVKRLRENNSFIQKLIVE